MTAPTRQHIYIYDHPESKIRFLETTLRGQDWMASIVVPPVQEANPGQYIDGLEKQLKERGFVTSRTAEADGTVSLHLHKLSKQTSAQDAFAELGLIRGTAHTVENLGTHLNKLVSGAMRYSYHMVTEPARLFSAIYMLGDVCYSFAGMSAKKHEPQTEATQSWGAKKLEEIKKLRDPENALLSLSGNLALAQSLIVIHYANNGGELNYNELKNQFKQGERAGIDAMDVKGWTAPGMDKRLLGPLDEVARKHPIDAGAWAQIMGQGSLAAASLINIKRNYAPHMKQIPRSEWFTALKTPDARTLINDAFTAEKARHYTHTRDALGSTINILRTVVSTFAWFTLMRPAKEGKVTADWHHPIEWIRQEMDIHPERAAGLINAGASGIGLAASVIKQNKATLWAESIWLAGDAVMMFAKKDHYGGAAARRDEPLIDAATKFMQEMPVVISASRQKAMVCDLALHLAQKTVDEQTDSKRARTAPITEEIANLTKSIEVGVNANLSMANTYYDRLTSACAILIERFPAPQREELITKLVHGLAASPGIYAAEEELVEAIRSRTDLKSGFGIDKPGMGIISRDIAQLVTAAPPIAKAGVADAIYDAVMPLIKSGPQDLTLLAKAATQAAPKAEQTKPATHLAKVSNQPLETAAARS